MSKQIDAWWDLEIDKLHIPAEFPKRQPRYAPITCHCMATSHYWLS